MSFKDHFSRQATDYAKFRPQYPRALYAFIARHSPDRELALDCATGNGQAALGLAELFQKVIAIDASARQIENAAPNDQVEYRVAPAEGSGLTARSFDAITVAQALHWFRLEEFYAEARRILKPGGLLAVWTYHHVRISLEVDRIVRRYHDEVVGPFWPPERKLVGPAYLDLPFPFAEIVSTEFRIEVHWSLEHLLGYLRTWSATQRFMAAKGNDPVELIAHDLAQAWGSVTEQLAIWPLTTRFGHA